MHHNPSDGLWHPSAYSFTSTKNQYSALFFWISFVTHSGSLCSTINRSSTQYQDCTSGSAWTSPQSGSSASAIIEMFFDQPDAQQLQIIWTHGPVQWSSKANCKWYCGWMLKMCDTQIRVFAQVKKFGLKLDASHFTLLAWSAKDALQFTLNSTFAPQKFGMMSSEFCKVNRKITLKTSCHSFKADRNWFWTSCLQ